MSADNWATCPFCVDAARIADEEMREAVRDAYGKIPADEYEEMRAGLLGEFDPSSLERTMREDWEVGLGGYDGTTKEADLIYRARCNVCGAGVEVKDTVVIKKAAS